jgi:hypothetical protein
LVPLSSHCPAQCCSPYELLLWQPDMYPSRKGQGLLMTEALMTGPLMTEAQAPEALLGNQWQLGEAFAVPAAAACERSHTADYLLRL